jgi:predicted NAD/FAD-binding protein
MFDMPLATFVRFCHNHGLLQIFDRPQWRTVKGGGREYVRRLVAQLDDVRTACPVGAVTRDGKGLLLAHAGGSERFDQVVMAGHSDAALAMRGAASPAQRAIWRRSGTSQTTRCCTDERLLPRDRKLCRLEPFRRAWRPGRSPSAFLPDQPAQPPPFRTP